MSQALLFTKRTIARMSRKDGKTTDVRKLDRLIAVNKMQPVALLVESEKRSLQLFDEHTTQAFLNGEIK